MVVIGGPTKSLAEADELLCGPLGDSLGLRRKKIVLPWTLEGPDSRSPPDADQTVEIFADAAPTVRECWLSVLAQFADQPAGREYIVYHNVDAGETVRLTYGQVGRMVEQIAWALQGMGLQKGDRVGIAMRNLPEFMPIWWAVTSMGYVVVPLNAWLMKGELEWCIKDAGCKVLFIDQERLERLGVSDGKGLADTAASAGGSVTHFVLVRSKLSEAAAGALRSKGIHTVPFHHLLDPTAPPKLPDVEVSMFDNSQILYSSGTTGHPKGVLHSNLQWAQQSVAFKYNMYRAFIRTGMDVPVPAPGEPAPQSCWFLPVPLFHLTGIAYTYGATLMGSKIVYVWKWNAEQAIDLISKEKITNHMGVPTMALQMLESPNFSVEKLKTLISLGYGGAPGPAALRTRAKEAFGNQPGLGEPSNTFGATECFGGASNSGPDYELKPSSVGRPIPLHKIEIRDSKGRPLPAGEIGDIWCKSWGVAKGYWNNPKATAESFQRGYYSFGDIGMIDKDGFLYLLDRSKDMLIRGGENVYCSETEAALLTHKAVMEAAVFGIPHRILGEEVGACVRIVPDQFGKITAEELIKHVTPLIAKFKVPAYIKLVNEALPATPSGKILKRELRISVGKEAGEKLGGEFAAKL